jgi:hypothetical protein
MLESQFADQEQKPTRVSFFSAVNEATVAMYTLIRTFVKSTMRINRKGQTCATVNFPLSAEVQVEDPSKPGEVLSFFVPAPRQKRAIAQLRRRAWLLAQFDRQDGSSTKAAIEEHLVDMISQMMCDVHAKAEVKAEAKVTKVGKRLQFQAKRDYEAAKRQAVVENHARLGEATSQIVTDAENKIISLKVQYQSELNKALDHAQGSTVNAARKNFEWLQRQYREKSKAIVEEMETTALDTAKLLTDEVCSPRSPLHRTSLPAMPHSIEKGAARPPPPPAPGCAKAAKWARESER